MPPLGRQTGYQNYASTQKRPENSEKVPAKAFRQNCPGEPFSQFIISWETGFENAVNNTFGEGLARHIKRGKQRPLSQISIASKSISAGA